MLRFVDRALSALLILGAAGHTFGVLQFYRTQPDALFWSLTETVLVLLLAAVNLLRAGRPTDRGLAWICVLFSAIYVGISLCFGRLIGDMLDFRVLAFGIVALGLTLFSLRTALGRA